MTGSVNEFRRVTATMSFFWCFLALILTSKFEVGSCQETKELTIEDPIFTWDGFRLNIDYEISDSVVAERVTHDIVSDEDCLGGIIEEEEIETEISYVSDTRMRISMLMNPESIHSSRYVSHYDDYAIVAVCARLWVNKPINNQFEPVTGFRDDYMLIKADLEELKGIEEVLDDKAKNWGVDVYQCDSSNNRMTDPPSIRNGEKLRICVEPTQRTLDENVFMGTIKSFHFEREGVIQKAVATYGTDEVTRVFDCHRGSNKCALETVLKNEFFFAPGEVKAEGLIYLQWGYEEDRKRNLRSAAVKINADLNLQQPEDRSLYEWYEQGEIVSEKSSIAMIKVEPMDKVYKAEAFACDEKNRPNQKKSLNETEIMRICIRPDKEAREAGVFINTLEAFELGLANDDKTQVAIDSFGVAANDNKTIVECPVGSDVCSIQSELRDWFFDEDAPMVASGYVVLQFGSFEQTRRRAQYGDEFAGRDQVEAYFDTVGRGPKIERVRPVKKWFDDIFDGADLSETHLMILYVVAIILFILILLCCLAGCLFFFWYGRAPSKEQPMGRSQHIEIKLNQDGKEAEQSEFADERRESQSHTEDDMNNSYYSNGNMYAAPSRRGSNRGSGVYDDDTYYSNTASRRGSNRGSGAYDDDTAYYSNPARRGSNGSSMPRRGSNGSSMPRRGSNGSHMPRRASNGGSQSRRGSNGSSMPRRASNGGDRSQSRRGSNGSSMPRRASNGGDRSQSRRGSTRSARGSQSHTEDDDVNTSYSGAGSRRGSTRSARGSQSHTEDDDVTTSYSGAGSRRGSTRSARGSQSHTEDDDVNTSYSGTGSRRGSARGSQPRRMSNDGSVSRRGSTGASRRGSNRG